MDDLERARRIAVALEGQVAALVQRMRQASLLLRDQPPCLCGDRDDDDGIGCLHARVQALLDTEWLNTAAMDRLYDVVIGVINAEQEEAQTSV